jgi:hypothetical protein
VWTAKPTGAPYPTKEEPTKEGPSPAPSTKEGPTKEGPSPTPSTKEGPTKEGPSPAPSTKVLNVRASTSTLVSPLCSPSHSVPRHTRTQFYTHSLTHTHTHTHTFPRTHTHTPHTHTNPQLRRAPPLLRIPLLPRYLHSILTLPHHYRILTPHPPHTHTPYTQEGPAGAAGAPTATQPARSPVWAQ